MRISEDLPRIKILWSSSLTHAIVLAINIPMSQGVLRLSGALGDTVVLVKRTRRNHMNRQSLDTDCESTITSSTTNTFLCNDVLLHIALTNVSGRAS